MLQLGVEMSLTQHDQRAIERQIAGQRIRHMGSSKLRFRPVTEISVAVKDVTPFVMYIKDLETTKFKAAKKRVLIYAFSVKMDFNQFVAPADPSLGPQKSI